MTNPENQHPVDPAHPGEFALIDEYFKTNTPLRNDVILGIGDDAALLEVPAQQLLVAAVDTVVAGVHFPLETEPYDIGYKALAVNLSDLAAMGAEPAWFTLALTMPQSDSVWLRDFSAGLFQLAQRYHLQLIGGDTTRGPLTITIQVHGFVPPDQAIKRSGANAGDVIYVSGTLGDAGLGLLVATGAMQLPADAREAELTHLHRPEPRVALGMALRGIASSAIDISDGLLADLQHILDASGKGAMIATERLPLSAVLREHLDAAQAIKLALTAGDDYELCFTIPPDKEEELQNICHTHRITCTSIGMITDDSGIMMSTDGDDVSKSGYQHF